MREDTLCAPFLYLIDEVVKSGNLLIAALVFIFILSQLTPHAQPLAARAWLLSCVTHTVAGSSAAGLGAVRSEPALSQYVAKTCRAPNGRRSQIACRAQRMRIR